MEVTSNFERTPSDRHVAPVAARLPARVPLEGREVRLEPLNVDAHADDLFEASHGTETARRIWDYLTMGPYPSSEDYRAEIRAQAIAFDPVFYAVILKHSGRAAGQMSYLDINAVHGSIEIGHIWFSPELQGSRAGLEALYLTMRHAFDDLGYRRLQWRCNALNKKSRKMALRLGFVFEGIFYNHMVAKGRNRDTAWYSIAEEEWPARRDLIEAWLGVENFDDDGRPRISLAEAMRDAFPDARRSD